MMSVVLRLLLACLVLSIMGCPGNGNQKPEAETKQTTVPKGEAKAQGADVTLPPDTSVGTPDGGSDLGGLSYPKSPQIFFSAMGVHEKSPKPEIKGPSEIPNPAPDLSKELNNKSSIDKGSQDEGAIAVLGDELESQPEDQGIFGQIGQTIENLLWGDESTAEAIFILLLVILAGLVAQVIAKATLARFLLMGATHQQLERKLSKAVGLASAGFVWSQLLQWELVGLQDSNYEFLISASRVFFVLAATLAGFRSVDALGVWATKRAGKTESSLDDILVPLGRKALKLLVVAFGLVNFAPLLGLEITPLLGALGVGGIGFAFAAQNTIENLFGSVTVVLDRPFSVGDWVEVDGVDGTVEEVGLRSTKVRTFYDSLVSIPNAKLTTAIVDNYGSRKYRRFKATLGVRYETTPEQIEAFCKGIKTLVADRSDTRKNNCYAELNGFGDSSLNIMLYMFFECEDWTSELRGRHELMLDIIRLAHELGVEFAFPTQIVHLAEQALPMARPDSFGAVNTSEAAGQLGEAKAKEIGGRGA